MSADTRKPGAGGAGLPGGVAQSRGGTRFAEGSSRNSGEQGYPHQPGYRAGPNCATSREASEFAARRAGPLKDRVLAMLQDGPASPEELRARFIQSGESVLLTTVRARCSDLHALGKVKPSGSFGKGESGKVRVIRWCLASAADGPAGG